MKLFNDVGFGKLVSSSCKCHNRHIEKAEREFEIYREREMRMLESDFDKAVKRLKNLNDNSNLSE